MQFSLFAGSFQFSSRAPLFLFLSLSLSLFLGACNIQFVLLLADPGLFAMMFAWKWCILSNWRSSPSVSFFIFSIHLEMINLLLDAGHLSRENEYSLFSLSLVPSFWCRCTFA